MTLLLCALAIAWFPIRLVQEANPEWRLVSWGLALDVVSLSLLLLRVTLCPQLFPSSVFVFPSFFLLVAVPWPTLIEAPLIQALTQANASCAVELINLFGTPAIQHGNRIEVTSGVVGIDEACSGIRSFQATLMVSLLLGELYRLPVRRRISLCLSGFALSFFYNVGRTTLLAWVAARKGGSAIQRWHDPAGAVILVLCFSSLWLLALSIRKRDNPAAAPPNSSRDHYQGPPQPVRVPGSVLALLIWFVLCEIATTAWYRSHESRATQFANWSVAWPSNNPNFRELPISDRVRRYLRCDEAFSAGWLGADGRRWQVIFLRWAPGKIAAHLARSHTPQTCLPASGRQIVSAAEMKLINVSGLALPFRKYMVSEGGRPLHVFYCLWEDRGTNQDFRSTDLNLWNRLEPVLAGCRNLGQRSLEVAIWGINDAEESEKALVQELKELIKME